MFQTQLFKTYLFIIILSTALYGFNTYPTLSPVIVDNTQLSDTTSPPIKAHTVVKITRSWKLPEKLRKISAIDYISPGRLACLDDETGSIFYYNIESGEIEKEIPFGPPGDYEGLVVINNETAYIACADGRILEITNNSGKAETKEFGTHLTVEENVNGLCYDKKINRLLVSVKGTEDANQYYKAIYSFDLASKRMPVEPAIKIDLKNRVFKKFQTKKVQMVFQPSDIDIDPSNGRIYIIDGTRGQLLRLRPSENIKDLIELDKNTIFQPEGISITPSGEIYIASKGMREEPGMLFQIHLK